MEFRTLPVGVLETNCYLVPLEKERTLAVIDPGGDAEAVIGEANAMKRDGFAWQQAEIWFTHAHVDHIHAAGEVARALAVRYVYLHSADLPLYHSPINMLPPCLNRAEDLPTPQTEWSHPEIQVLPVPGHTPGGVGFYFPEQQLLFSGDSLFDGSIGRTDLPGGNFADLLNGIKTQFLTLPDETRVYPGHGGPTRIGQEKRFNPYLV